MNITIHTQERLIPSPMHLLPMCLIIICILVCIILNSHQIFIQADIIPMQICNLGHRMYSEKYVSNAYFYTLPVEIAVWFSGILPVKMERAV